MKQTLLRILNLILVWTTVFAPFPPIASAITVASPGGPAGVNNQPISPSQVTISGNANAPSARFDSTGKLIAGPAPVVAATITTSPLTIPATNYTSYSATAVTGAASTDVVNLANPTAPIGAGYEYTVINDGSTTFAVLGRTVTVGQSLTVTWDGTAWRLPVDGSTAVSPSKPLLASDADGNVIAATTPIPQSLGGTGQTSLPLSAAALATDATGTIIAGAANPTVATSQSIAATDASGNIIGATLPLTQAQGGTGQTSIPASAATLASDAAGAIIAGPNPVTGVTGTAPVVSSGGATPAISLGTVPTTLGGTGLSTIGTAGQALKVNSSATGLEYINGETTKHVAAATTQTLTDWGQTVSVDGSTGAVTITLPTAVNKAGRSIEVVRVDNSSNAVCVDGAAVETINGSTNVLCLYNKYDSVVFRSDGTNVIVVADNRASAGSNKSFLFAKATVAQNISAANTVVNFGSVDASFGSDITLDTGTGIFILKAWKTYRLQGVIPYGAVSQEFKWFNNTGNAYFGTTAKLSNVAEGETAVSNAVITPTVDTSVTLRAVSISSSGNIGLVSGDRNLVANAYIEVISAPAVVTNTMDYITARSSVNQSITAVNQVIAISTVISGNIPLASNNFTLSSGKTYRIVFNSANKLSGLNVDVQWYSVTNSAFIASSPVITLYNQAVLGYAATDDFEFIYTPTVNEVIQLRVSFFNASGILGETTRNSFSKVTIQQIGSSAATVPANTPVLGTDANGNFIAGTVPTATVEYGYAYGFGFAQNITTTISAVNVSHQSGNLSFNTANKTYALSAGKTYRVQAGVRGDLTGNVLRVRLRDTTNNVTLSPNNGNLAANNWLAQRATSLNNRDNSTVSAIYTPTANGAVGIEVFSDTGVATLQDAYLEIVQIGTTATIFPSNNVAFGANLKGWWKLNESGPTDTAINSSPSALNLPATVTTNLVLSGGIGRTARGNSSATNNTGRLTAGTPCFTTNTNFGMAVWLNPLSIPLLGVAYNVGNGSTNGMGIGVSNGGLGSGSTVVVQLPNVGTITSAISISATQWVHVVFTRGSGNSLIYVNGVLVTSSPLVPVAPTTATSLFYNGNAGHGQWRGSIQDAICVNREITASEAAKLASREPIATIQ